MDRKYIYEYHDGSEFFISDKELTSEELYCPHCKCSDTFYGVYDDEGEFDNAVRRLFIEGRHL